MADSIDAPQAPSHPDPVQSLLMEETLVLLLAVTLDLLVAPSIVAIMVLAELFLTGCALVLGRRSTRDSGARPPRSRAARWLAGSFALLLTGTLAVLVLADVFLLEDGLRWALGRLEAQRGLRVGFERARGRFLGGSIVLSDLRFAKETGEGSRFALVIARLEVDVDLRSLMVGRPGLEAIRIAGVRGWFERRPGPGRSSPARSRTRGTTGRLEVTDVRLEIRGPPEQPAPGEDSGVGPGDGAAPGSPGSRGSDLPPGALPSRVLLVELDSLVGRDLRHDRAVFDLLFRCEAAGKLDGHPFRMVRDRCDPDATDASPAGASGTERSCWTLVDLPLQSLGVLIDPLRTWVRSGRVGLAVASRFGEAESMVTMDWTLDLRDVKTRLPDSGGLAVRALGRAAVTLLNRRLGDRRLVFTVALDRDRFRGAASSERAGMWSEVAASLKAGIGRRAREAAPAPGG